jgi:hypothetical protein
MEQLYFTPENKKIITENVMGTISTVMPKNTIDYIGVQNIILNNMQNIVKVVDTTKVNSSNFKNVLKQINNLAVKTSVKQVVSKEKTNFGNIKFQRDNDLRMYNKNNPYGDRQSALASVERPMVVSGSKDISQNLDAIMAERDSLDNMIGVKKNLSPQMMAPQTPSLEGITSGNEGFSDVGDVFGNTITNGVNINENTFESFDQRLRRIQTERDTTITPSADSTNEFKKLTNQSNTDDGQSLENKFRQAHDDRITLYNPIENNFPPPNINLPYQQGFPPPNNSQQGYSQSNNIQQGYSQSNNIQQGFPPPNNIQQNFPPPNINVPQNFPPPNINVPQNFPPPNINVPQNFPPPNINVPQNFPQPNINVPQQNNFSISNSNEKHVTFSEPVVTEPDQGPTGNYTNILNVIITKEKIIDEKFRDLEMRERQFMENQIKQRDIMSLLSFNFQHVIIDTRVFEQSGLNAYVFNFNTPINNLERIQILNISIPILNYNIANKQYFEYFIEDEERLIHVPRGNYNINQLMELINSRNTDDFKLKLNPLTDCLFIETNKSIKIKKNYISKKLGLDAGLISTRPYDLRVINYLTLYIKNIFQEKAICRVNPHNFTPIDIVFNEPIILDRFEIEFRDIDNIIVDFEGRHHIIEFRIFHKELN